MGILTRVRESYKEQQTDVQRVDVSKSNDFTFPLDEQVRPGDEIQLATGAIGIIYDIDFVESTAMCHLPEQNLNVLVKVPLYLIKVTRKPFPAEGTTFTALMKINGRKRKYNCVCVDYDIEDNTVTAQVDIGGEWQTYNIPTYLLVED